MVVVLVLLVAVLVTLLLLLLLLLPQRATGHDRTKLAVERAAGGSSSVRIHFHQR